MDLITFSYDRFHAEEVLLGDLLRAMRRTMDAGPEVALQMVEGVHDKEFGDSIVNAVAHEFNGSVPVVRLPLTGHGRARALMGTSTTSSGLHDSPCLVSTWPVVSYTGWIVACCEQSVVDSATPPGHLRLGRIEESTYPGVAQLNAELAALRLLRLHGPSSLGPPQERDNYCAPCIRFDSDDEDELEQKAERLAPRRIQEAFQALSSLSAFEIARPGATC